MPKKPSRKTLKRKADKLWAGLIKAEGKCEAEGHEIRCNGVLQAAHVIRRGYLATRWDLNNGIALCQAHHVFWTHRPYEWEDWVTTHHMSSTTYAELRRRAIESNGPPDYDAVIGRLVARSLLRNALKRERAKGRTLRDLAQETGLSWARIHQLTKEGR